MHTDADVLLAAEAILTATHALALTGAGVSTASGLPDFRSPTGLWATVDPAEIARERTLREQPERFWRFYAERFRGLDGIEPNAAHSWLADLERAGRLHGVITQNVDGLHQSAGSKTVWGVHGALAPLRCIDCAHEQPWQDVDGVPTCAACTGPVRPGVVFFGESLHADFDRALSALSRCDLLVVMGSSLQVTPAASLPAYVLAQGGRVILVNQGATPYDETPGVIRLWGAITEIVEQLDAIMPRAGDAR